MSEPRPRRSAKLLTALIGLILAISAGYALRSMQAAQRQLDSARTDLQRAQEMASEIVRLRDQRRIASLAVEASSQIAERVSSSLQAAGVAPASLIRVEPQSAVRIGRTPYLLRATNIELREASLEQVIRFAHLLTDDSQGMTVRDLTLLDPQAGAAGHETWLAKVTLTQMIFSPTIP